ncbi:protein MRG1-like [Curcuma longa]|uniref:protein MRG1-like n=1 Tax=Curcuma longa TaxID=136217 RepID=UPI003D9E16EF
MGSTNTGTGVKEETSTDGDGGDNAAAAGRNDASDPSGGGVFAEGEKVLAYHGPLIYEAKIQKAEIRKDEWRYFVHYLGWSKNWDEWVPADRMLKHTEENIRKQQALEKNQNSEKNPRYGRSTQNKLKDAKVDKEDPKSYVSKGKKRKVQSDLQDEKIPENLVKLQFPVTLKKQLVDEWEFVTQMGKLVKLPRSPNVDEILKKYLDFQIQKDGMITESVGEILKGLRCYFDKALPAMLLYKKERHQYHKTIRDDVSPSTVYGAEHLLRLFVKLPELLACVNMEEEALAKLQKKLLDILRFLQKNQSTFFLSAYDGSTGGADESDAK